MDTISSVSVQAFSDVANEMAASMASVRETVQTLAKKQRNTSELDLKSGISLLSLKDHTLLSYLQSLVLLSSHRMLGHSLLERTAPSASFGTAEREKRGIEAGDLVDSLVESRIILEKVKILETKMKYQIDKLVRMAEDNSTDAQNVTDDPLAFRPNPQNLIEETQDAAASDNDEDEEPDRSGVYRPPKLAPMPYNETSRKDKSKRRAPVPSALASLAYNDPSNPHVESTSGLGSMPSLSTARARELDRMTRFEEENMTRLVLNKKETLRRKRDEADIALGGTGMIEGRGKRGGLAEEFGDIFRSVAKNKHSFGGDGYEELRNKSKKQGVLERSRQRSTAEVDDGPSDNGRAKKKGRFERDIKTMKKKSKSRR
ncbi:hypothetical protein BOTBODRAFT_56937 [Botryobasidium botryosum FD-172 SS1]|uniref:Neuroguidin n=1 Tax=Botryobasidium botryosum (strain FD-172 SS1) TaxID=930990 RepID=A0A067MKJ7_BOTB1|nr:hypothetical protein BOTBODRAFT_56937 [Botryobasidium botryosum FD-172 SS1]